MPSCVAQECSNSWKTGYKMCSFPIKDIERCAIWVHNVNRPNWTPSRHSTLCQIHFAPEMWEQHRTDGLLKLKRNAIPTIFKTVPEELIITKIENKDTYIPIKDLTPTESLLIKMENRDAHIPIKDLTPTESSLIKMENRDAYIPIKDYMPSESLLIKMENRDVYRRPIEDFTQSENLLTQENLSTIYENEPMENKDIDHDIDITIENIKIEDGEFVQHTPNEALNSCPSCLQKEKKMEEMFKVFTKVDRLHRHAKQKLLIAKRKIKLLQQQALTSNTLVANVKKILDDSQVKLLSGEFKKVPIWCANTIQKALKLRLACGSTGYEELIRNFPLPSLRTLNRRIKHKPE